MSNDTDSWDNWRVPETTFLCFEGGLSSIAFDVCVFGHKQYEVYVEEGHFIVFDKITSKLNETGEIARLPLPATFDEVVTWARMCAAIHSNKS